MKNIGRRVPRRRRRSPAARPDCAHGAAPGRPDRGPDPVVETRRLAGDFARRPLGGLHDPHHELGRQRLRHANLDRGYRERNDTSADRRTQIEHVTRVVARRLAARLHLRPQRQTADLPDQSASRRSRGVDLRRRWRQRVCVVAGWRSHRVHGHRTAAAARQGPREEIRRVRGDRSGSANGASVRDRRRDPNDADADARRVRRQQLRLVARRARDRVRPRRQQRSRQLRHRRHLHRQGRGRDGARSRHAGRARPPPGVVAGRLAHRVSIRDGEPGIRVHRIR